MTETDIKIGFFSKNIFLPKVIDELCLLCLHVGERERGKFSEFTIHDRRF